jgi:ABC-type spermidine/putrescine transport system permease subunit II
MDAAPPGSNDNGTRSLDEETRSLEAPKQEPSVRSRGFIIGMVVAALVLLVLIGLGAWALVNNPPLAATLRDIFIIALALESVIIGLTLLLLLIQVTRLINLLQDEIKPILESTNQTVNTLRGTTTFMSEKVVTPVVNLSSYVAGMRRAVEVLTGIRRPRR